MDPIRRIQNLEKIKLLTDGRRLEILQRLMSGPETLSSLGKYLGEHPARVRHHLKLLENAGLIELVNTRTMRGFVEKYYQAKARAFVFHELILPKHADPDRNTLVILGSHDLALEILAQHMQALPDSAELLALPVGSLEGLIALRQGLAHLAGCHLLDAETGEYNLPYVRHLFPDQLTTLITLAHRQQGLLVQPGNPRQIHALDDLARKDIQLINRNRGSGTRLWLDRQLHKLGLGGEEINGYNLEARTHTAVAEAILRGKANAGIGLEAAARQYGLEFIPLFQERFDLVIPQDHLDDKQFIPLLDYLQSGKFRQAVVNLGGYDITHTGDQLRP